MSVDFPRAWEISRDPDAVHDSECSHEQTGGALLCDCGVLFKHPEYLDDVLHSRGGAVWEVSFPGRDSGGIDGGFLLAFAVTLAVVLVYVAAGGAR